jgi:glycerate 2-kinase
MKHILIAPGAFKHSLTAAQASAAIARGLEQAGIHLPLIQMPIADGGNGTLDAFLAHGGERIELMVNDPLMRPLEAAYGLMPDGTAVIEMALASGLELLADTERDPFRATTYGTGQLMQHALEHGARRFIVGIWAAAPPMTAAQGRYRR